MRRGLGPPRCAAAPRPELFVEPSHRQHLVAADGHPGADPSSAGLRQQRAHDETSIDLVVGDEAEVAVVRSGFDATEPDRDPFRGRHGVMEGPRPVGGDGDVVIDDQHQVMDRSAQADVACGADTAGRRADDGETIVLDHVADDRRGDIGRALVHDHQLDVDPFAGEHRADRVTNARTALRADHDADGGPWDLRMPGGGRTSTAGGTRRAG